MKITIVYDNTAFTKDLRADWGFSCLVETHNRKILFDTGANGSILLYNMKKLNIKPDEIEDVFISHAHFDHTGGLSALLGQNDKVKLWIPPSFQRLGHAKEVIKVEKPGEIYKGIYSTGELEGIEQSLCVETKRGIVIIVGCSHPRMEHISKTASQFGSIYGIIGGLHGTRPESLKDFDLICAAHCTQFKTEIKLRYPEKVIKGGVGKVIEI